MEDIVIDLPGFIRSLAPDSVEAAIEKAAQLFDERPGTVKAWLYRERLPRPETAPKLIERASGRLSYESIYKPRPEAEAA